MADNIRELDKLLSERISLIEEDELGCCDKQKWNKIERPEFPEFIMERSDIKIY